LPSVLLPTDDDLTVAGGVFPSRPEAVFDRSSALRRRIRRRPAPVV